MTQIQLTPPRALRATRPARVVLMGGFLGAGKTTMLGALGRRFGERGERVAFVTNDQAGGLVDTAVLSGGGQTVGEVAGGCFCCRFEDLLDTMQIALDGQPDLLLCEAVGSCTDMAATVIAPLRFFYREVLSVAPFAVMADPQRLREAVLGEAPARFAPEVGYIFLKQLEEADVIVLNKVDTLDASEADRIALALGERYQRPVLRTSAVTGEGLDELVQLLSDDRAAGSRILPELDYDRYARGEAVLGWLNATADVSAPAGFDGRALVESLLDRLRAECRQTGAEIAHVKATLAEGDRLVQGNLVRTDAEASVQGPDGETRQTRGTLTLNARVAIDPGALGGVAASAVVATAAQAGAVAEIRTLQCFSPGYPRPPYRMAAVE